MRVALHMIRQPQRVIADQCPGAIRVALFQRLNDVHVIPDRPIGAILLADGLAPDHAHVREQILRKVDQHPILSSCR